MRRRLTVRSEDGFETPSSYLLFFFLATLENLSSTENTRAIRCRCKGVLISSLLLLLLNLVA
jgi:hypothetical protein